MQQRLKKGLSALIATIIILANTSPVISYAADNLKSQEELEKQKTTTNNSNVEFDVYYDEGAHTKELDINSQEESVNVRINVKNAGYLKNITVDFSGSNFNVTQSEGSKAQVDSKNKTATFEQINNGSDVTGKVNISAIIDNQISIQNFAKDNDIKLTATYVNAKGEEENIEKTIVLQTIWTMVNKVESNFEYNINSYYTYENENKNKLVIFANAISGMQNGSLPIKNTSIEIIAPQLNNKYPEEVFVSTKSTVATNGDFLGTSFTKENYTYDTESGKINISVDNKEQDGNINWTKNVQDEYEIAFVYSIEDSEKIEMDKAVINKNATLKISLYGSDEVVEKAISENVENINKTTNSIMTSLNSVQTLNKGYMYNNKLTSEVNKNETEYEVTYNTNIPYANIIEGLIINIKEDNALAEESILKTESGLSYIKTVKIAKEQFDKMLGEEGSITVKNEEGTILGTITKDTEDLTLNIEESNVSSIVIETSKPITEGSINIYVKKAIKKELTYTTNQIKSLTSIKIENETTAKDASQKEIAKIVNEARITLEEPTQKAELYVSTDTLSTIVTNEDVNISVTLENDSADDILYNNPEVTIVLPSNIQNINIKDTKILFDDELKIENVDLVDNEDGTKSINIKLSGQQTKYNNTVVKGATISIIADITLNNLTPTTNTEIKAIIEDGVQPVIEISTGIKYVSPSSVVTITEVTGTDEGNITAVNEDVSLSISANEESKELTFNMSVINNYQNTLDNVVVLGRIPNDGTLQFTLKEAIKVEGVTNTIYYSEVQNATNDLSNESNGWKTTVDDYSKIKSYMIVLNDYTMNGGDSFKFSYQAIIPENVGYEKNITEGYEVYFNNNLTTGTIADKVVAPKINFVTGENATLTAKLEVMEQESESAIGIFKFKYLLTISNPGTVDAKDVKAKIILPKDAIYIRNEADSGEIEEDNEQNSVITAEQINEYTEKFQNGEITAEEYIAFMEQALSQNQSQDEIYEENVIKIGDIKQNQTVTEEIEIIYFTSPSEENFVVEAQIICGEEIVTTAKAESLKVEATGITINTDIIYDEEEYLVKGAKVYYTMVITPSKDELNNVVARIELPQELIYKETNVGTSVITNKEESTNDIESNVSNDGNSINVEIPGITDNCVITVVTEIGEMEEGIYQKNITISGTVEAEGIKPNKAPDEIITINKPGIAVEQTSNIPQGASIEAGEDFAYIFTIQNLSNVSLEKVTLTDNLPSQLEFNSLTVSYGGENIVTSTKTDENGKPMVEFYLAGNGTAVVTLNVKANGVEEETKITNGAIIKNELIGEIETNQVSHIIKKYDGTISSGNDDDNTENIGKKIIGTVWIDGNEDGIKDLNETKVSGVEVVLLDNNTGNIAVTEENKQAITTTDEDGAYMFNNLKKGSYTVIFLYDSENYSATTFEKEGVSESLNSNAVDKQVEYEGSIIVAGVTEEIILDTKNIFDVNLGIISNKKFDLKLDKIVTNIKINNSKDVTTHTFNSNFAKIDFEAKDVDTSTMIVEYKFTITNEGDVAGYVKKLADYVPSELKFSSELNPDWYEASSGTIINNTLANKAINPGESVEVNLTLTKTMSDDAMGIVIKNTAEIYEASNDYGLQDKDSVPGNKITNEDDISTANVLTSVKTGQPVYYILITIAVMGILIVGVYLIRKKVIK